MNLIFEIGCEELPASAIEIATQFLPAQLKSELEAARLDCEAIESLATPRRILLLALNVSSVQKNLQVEVLGPRVEAAYNASGELTPAGLGFLKAKNIDPKDAYQKQTEKGLVLAAQLHEKGKPALHILSEILPRITLQIPFSKTMRWEKSKTRFARPIRWLLCLLDNQIVPFEIAGVRTSNKTCGHRFLSPGFQQVSSETYFDFLAKHQVVFDQQKRKAQILDQAQKLAASVGGELKPDSQLLDTVANLVEYPWPILGHFDEKYLEIPQEILICEMREHQKYFSILDKDQKLMPYFVVVAGAQPVNADRLAAGNARVLKARFEDGAFYYREDLKKPLVEFLDKPTETLTNWALKLGSLLNLQEQNKLERAATLCKADLNTGVVGEFPELQGIMGAIYAARGGESADVCSAIREHYWPRFSGDQIPTTQLGSILSLADRLNTLTSRKLPKGSADPYGLRRAAIGLSRIILDNQLTINLRDLINNQEILEFVMARARGVFLENHATLVVDATQTAAGYDLRAWQARIQALAQFDYATVSAVFKRVNNIVAKDSSQTPGSLEKLSEAVELELLKAVNQVDIGQDFELLLSQLGALKPLLDRFFEEIMVMTEDLELRAARLTLLTQVQRKAAFIADFSKLVVS